VGEVREVVGKGGEMTHTLYAHINKKISREVNGTHMKKKKKQRQKYIIFSHKVSKK
jgi:hypothetical protein